MPDKFLEILAGIPVRSEFQAYCQIMGNKAWNRSLGVLYDTRSYEAGLAGARKLIDLTELFKRELGDKYERHLIRLALLELTCLDRLDWIWDYLVTWQAWRSQPLTIPYRLSRWGDSRIHPFVIRETNTRLDVHFLYLTWARKKVIERKLGTKFKRHARQEDLTDEELRNRLARR